MNHVYLHWKFILGMVLTSGIRFRISKGPKKIFFFFSVEKEETVVMHGRFIGSRLISEKEKKIDFFIFYLWENLVNCTEK